MRQISAKNRRLDSLAWLICANDGCASATFVDGQRLLATNSSRISDMPSIRINRQEVKLYEGVTGNPTSFHRILQRQSLEEETNEDRKRSNVNSKARVITRDLQPIA